MDQVKTEEPEALKLLYYCAFLPAKNIPREFLEKLFEAINLNKYISALDTLILADTTTVSIHDLFQEIIEGQISSQKKVLLSNLGKASDGFEEFLLEHPKKALPIFQQNLEDYEQRTSPDEEKIASISNYLGMVCGSLGDYHASLIYNKKSLEICKKVLGEEDPGTAMSYNNIGASLGALGRHEEALKYHKKSLETREKVLGKEHPDTAMSYNGIGISLKNLGRHAEALGYFQKAFQISCEFYPNKYHETISSNFFLCLLHQHNQQYGEQVRLETLSLCEKKFGEEGCFMRYLLDTE